LPAAKLHCCLETAAAMPPSMSIFYLRSFACGETSGWGNSGSHAANFTKSLVQARLNV